MPNNKIILIEDDAFLSKALKSTLLEINLTCDVYSSLADAESTLKRTAPFAAIVDLAIPTAKSKIIQQWKSHADFEGGLAFIKAAKLKWSATKFILLTGQPSLDAKAWCDSNNVHYAIKPISKLQIENILGLRQTLAFVVHGRNMVALKQVKAALQALNIEPIVLMEQPSKGKTVMEKFEAVSEKCDCAIVAMSPDDVGKLATSALTKIQFRARQNVIFELGFFYGCFGRTSGRVVLIEFGNTEIPSDISGVVRIDGRGGKARLVKQLRVELNV